MKTGDRPFLDACLIVKNEEKHLPECLDSLHRLGEALNAINIYDTGSTDATLEIARAAGCNVRVGYWDGDFSRARNESLRMSRAEWTLVIDADERVFADPDVLVASLHAVAWANVVDAELYHLDEEGNRVGHTRYIKAVRPRQIRFALPVHEVVDARPGYSVEFVRLAPEQMHFTHLGYSSAEVRRGKAQRNLQLADAAVTAAREAGNAVALVHALRHRARSWTGEGSRERSISDLTETWDLLPQDSHDWIVCGLDLFDRHLYGNDFEAATRVVDQVRAVGVPPSRWLKAEGELQLRQGLLSEARVTADRLLKETATAEEGARFIPGSVVDRRDALDLRYRVALEGQEHAVAVAVCVLLIAQGEVDRVSPLVELWMNDARALARVLAAAARGPHGPAVLRALRATGPLGEAAAEVLSDADVGQNATNSVDQA